MAAARVKFSGGDTTAKMTGVVTKGIQRQV